MFSASLTAPSELSLQTGDLGFKGENTTNTGERHPFPGHLRDGGDLVDLGTGVSTLASVGTRRLDDAFGVQTSNERRLHSDHVRHLPNRVERSVMVVEERGARGHDQTALPTGSRLSNFASRVVSSPLRAPLGVAPTSMAAEASTARTATRLGFARSATGTFNVRTPSV